MTSEEYIALTKKILPVRTGRYEDIIRMTFDEIISMDWFKKSNIDIQFKIISSTSMFSEVVNTKPALTFIWDNYQWEILEKFLTSALLYINNYKELAVEIYKMNIYSALSVRVTNIAPELSYIFAKKYRELKDAVKYDFICMYSSAPSDMLFCQLLSLGHEFSHILFEQMDYGAVLYNLYEEDFFCIMDGAIKSKVISHFKVNGIDMEKLIHNIKSDINKEYRKELICDAFSYSLLGELLEKLDSKLNKERKREDLYDDIISMNDFMIRTMDSFSYFLEYWMRFGSLVSTKRYVEPKDLGIDIPNFTIWKNQYYARENLVSLYLRVVLLRDKNLNVVSANKKNTLLYNANCEIAQNLLSFKDEEWLEMIVELQQLMNKNISSKELIEARDSQLQI